MIKCSKCGAELSDNAKFCSFCGHKLDSSAESSFHNTKERNTSTHNFDSITEKYFCIIKKN